MLEIFLIIAAAWFALVTVALALGRVAAQADRRTEDALASPRRLATARVLPARPARRPVRTPSVRRSRVRIGPA